MIGIIDYSVGNILSVKNMLTKIGADSKVESHPGKLKNYNKIIIPGIGHFDHGAGSLLRSGFSEAIIDFASCGKYILGICLGMQLLFKKSDEGKKAGLGLIDGSLKKFEFSETEYPVPHMGWNDVYFSGGLLGKGHASFYFAHSFYLPSENKFSSAYTEYGIKFSSIVEKENILGVQFHPEKSHRHGMALLENFHKVKP